jgi:UDP-N-acetylglucosamine--N-acetylmuramyl-(pentapeptide) pyrophosphoryl-undecaprenol N-acetylglucosamine transferase
MFTRIAITGGGTAGHVFPAIAVAKELEGKNDTLKLYWVGSRKGMERKLVEQAGIPFYSIASGKLRRYFDLQNFLDIFKILFAIKQSLLIFLFRRPKLLFSKGGYVSVPPIIAAFILRIPVVVHESDWDPGLATKLGSKFARTICVSYEETKKFFPNKQVEVTGNPIRAEFYEKTPSVRQKYGIPQESFFVLALGGSSGAAQINTMIASHRKNFHESVYIMHQMGEKQFIDIQEPGYRTVAFISEDMNALLQDADLVISRAGAAFLWEMARLGKPMLLLPLKEGSRGDQIRNAEHFQSQAAAIILADDGSNLIELVESLRKDKQMRKCMGEAAKKLTSLRGAEKIADILDRIVTR